MNNSNNYPIGIFDSGVGGLTVFKEVMTHLPNEKIVYFGDTARVPYGSKSKDTILKYSRQIVEFLYTKKVKAIVVACNTASAFALEEIKDEIDVPIIGVVKPGAKVAASKTINNKIGIIGTEGTINSEIYTEFIKDIKPEASVIGKACPLFVPLVEEGWIHDEVTNEVARRYLLSLKDKDIDTLILGCTHYPLLKDTIKYIMEENVKLINPAYETAMELKRLLESENILAIASEPTSVKHEFYVSDAAIKFKSFAKSILPELEDFNIEKIDIENF